MSSIQFGRHKLTVNSSSVYRTHCRNSYSTLDLIYATIAVYFAASITGITDMERHCIGRGRLGGASVPIHVFYHNFE